MAGTGNKTQKYSARGGLEYPKPLLALKMDLTARVLCSELVQSNVDKMYLLENNEIYSMSTDNTLCLI
jgi:hypothetical protein